MKILTAQDIKLMGELDPKYGQTYWGSVEEHDDNVRFNLMQQVDIMPGRKIIAEEWAMKTSGTGNDYMQLRKVKLSESEPSEPTPAVEQEDLGWAAEEDSPSVSEATSDGWKDRAVEAPTEAPSGVDTPSYEAGTNARWAIGMAYRAYQQVMGTPEAGDGEFPFDVVLLHAQELVGMFEILKNPSGYDKAKATASKLPRKDEDVGE
jgi:hypothetical protein